VASAFELRFELRLGAPAPCARPLAPTRSPLPGALSLPPSVLLVGRVSSRRFSNAKIGD